MERTGKIILLIGRPEPDDQARISSATNVIDPMANSRLEPSSVTC